MWTYQELDLFQPNIAHPQQSNPNAALEDIVISMEVPSTSQDHVLEERPRSVKINEVRLQQLMPNTALTDKILLMDISADRQWICYTALFWNEVDNRFTTRLVTRKFIALNDETLAEESFTRGSGNMSAASLQRFEHEIAEYYRTGHEFLSISSKGQYIALSAYDENKGAKDELCLIFKIDEERISLLHEIKFNGRAVFLDRDNELCLAMINDETLDIWYDVHTFSRNIMKVTYDITPLSTNFSNGMPMKHFITDHILTKSEDDKKLNVEKAMGIVQMSNFIKMDILVTRFNDGSDVVRLWSLENGGARLASIATCEDIIAISNDLKYVATTSSALLDLKNTRIVKVYNAENGSLAYTLKSTTDIYIITHAIFCYNSRYLAVAATQKVPNPQFLHSKAVFEVWHITEQKSIYAITKDLIPTIGRDWRRFTVLKPFVLEETTDGRAKLKGFYSHSNEEGDSFTTKCFQLNIDGQPKTLVNWVPEDELNPVKTARRFLSWFYKILHNGESDIYTDEIQELLDLDQAIYLDILQDQLFNTYFQRSIDVNRNLEDPQKYYRLKSVCAQMGYGRYISRCGFIQIPYGKFLIRCGFNMIQFWEQIGESQSQDEDMHNYRLVYIKSYIVFNHRSCYLSPNIWRIKSLDDEDIKIFDSQKSLRVVLNIVEDDTITTLRGELKFYTEEFTVPISDDDNSFDYSKLESASQSLYFLYIVLMRIADGETAKRHLEVVFEKTLLIIKSEINKMDGDCNSFKTMNGSKTLAMLASFQKGRDILKLLLSNEAVSFNILRYSVNEARGLVTINSAEEVRYNASEYAYSYDENAIVSEIPESVLTVLIREREYDLYHLFFNRILTDSKNTIGSEYLTVLSDAIYLLQEFGITDHYQKSCHKLSYLRAGKVALVQSEIHLVVPRKADLQEDLIMNVGNVYYFSTMETLRKLNTHTQIYCLYELKLKMLLSPTIRNTWKKKLINWVIELIVWTSMVVYWIMKLIIWILKSAMWILEFLLGIFTGLCRDTQGKPFSQFVACVVPLPNFNTYYRTNIRDVFVNNAHPHSPKTSSNQSSYRKESLFIQSTLDNREPNIWRQGDDVVAILLQYKWNAFARKRFFLVYAIHMVYYICYCTGVQFALEMYSYDSTNNNRSIRASSKHLASISIFFLSAFILFILEMLQIIKTKKIMHYLKSGYNYIDFAAIVLPVVNFVQLTQNLNYFYEISSACTLILWLHGIVRLRVFSFFGIALETILQLLRTVYSVLFILLLILIGFTHSFVSLLRRREDVYFQEKYSGEISSNLTKGEATLYDSSSSNGFSNPFKGFYHVWLFVFGQWDPITTGEAGDDPMLLVLTMFFAFITVLLFTNMIIALMANTVEEVKQRGKKVWITHFAAVIAEMENLTSKSTKYDTVNNPAFIYYAGNIGKVKRQEEKLRHETQELRRLLKIDVDEHVHCSGQNEESTKKIEKDVQDIYQLLASSMRKKKVNYRRRRYGKQ